METGNAESDVSESVSISLLIAVVATALIYLELWGGSLPAFDAGEIAVGIGLGLVAGAAFYYRGTRSTWLDDVPPLAIFLALAMTVYVFFPEGLPPVVELGIVVGVWTDAVLRAGAKVA